MAEIKSSTPPSTPTLVIRKATPDDLPLLQPLVQSAYRGEASRKGWTTEADLVAGQRIDAAGLLLKINEPLGAVLIAFPTDPSGEQEPKPIACCEVLVSPHEDHGDGGGGGGRGDDPVAYFGMFAVDPERQGGGVGKVVLARAEAYARDTWGARKMEMTVIWTRDELIAWYARRGYVRTDEKRPFPYGELSNGVPLRDDLHFVVLVKQL